MAAVGSSTQTPLEHLRTPEHLTSQEVQQDVGLTQTNTTKDGVCCAHCNSNMSADHQPRERRDSDTSHKAKSFFITDILGTDFGTNCRSDDTEDNRSEETSPPVNHEPYSAVLHTHPDYKEQFDRFRLTFDSNASALLRNYSQIPHQIPLIRPAPVFPLIQAPSRLFHGTHAAFGCFREQRHNNLLIREIADTEEDETHTDGSQSPDPELKHSSIPLPRRLQELVQRDPKRQRILHLQDTANSQYREYGQDFPVGFPGKSVAGSASSRGLNTEGGWPAWVYCTRYSDRPTAGPRTRKMKRPRSEEPETREQKEIPECKKRENGDDGAGSAPDNKRPRTAFTDSQLMRLREEFQKNHYLTEDRRKGLAWELGLGETQVKIWFQNKRAKIKKNSDYKTTLAEELLAQGLYNHSMQ